jgi:hypothetical protein
MSGRSTVVVTEPVVVAGNGGDGSDALVSSEPSIFWLSAERQPRPIVVVGVGVRVTPAVAP